MIKKMVSYAGKALLAVPALALAFSFMTVTPATAQPGCAEGAGGLQGGVECAQPTGAPPNLFGDGSIFQTITNILLFLVGAISVIFLIIGGIKYVTSNGNEKNVESAKNTILYAIIGIVIAFLAFALVNFITQSLLTTDGAG